MATLTPYQLHERLRFDFRIAMSMRSPIMNVAAFREVDDLANQRKPILLEQDAHLATHYRIDYWIRTLIGPGEYSDLTTVHVDLLANHDYPYSAPCCWVTSSRMPWSPYFRDGFPICISYDLWSENVLLGELLVHLAKLLNLDEINNSEYYGGYNPEAADYWRTKLNSQPITPNLSYPPLPPNFGSPSIGAIINRIVGVRKDDKPKRPLRAFLCHSSTDKELVRKLYDRLCANGIDAWIDEEKLLVGQRWEVEIGRAVRNSDVVIVCLSQNAIDKSGFIQKEILMALDVAEEKPEDMVFVIPYRLEPCEIPNRLRHLHCAPFSEEEGYERLMKSLEICAHNLTDPPTTNS
jgi:hypothetical protein